jgi:hypothetical protein
VWTVVINAPLGHRSYSHHQGVPGSLLSAVSVAINAAVLIDEWVPISVSYEALISMIVSLKKSMRFAVSCCNFFLMPIVLVFYVSGKEKELLAMQVGGNSLINGLFEATLSDKERPTVKPDNHTDHNLRSQFIFDKYQHRKWYSEEIYKKLKLREKADIALQKHKAKTALCADEEDFFATRTGKKRNPIGDNFVMKENDEKEWWKDDERNRRAQNYIVSSNSQVSSKVMSFQGDRRDLLSKLQIESKSKLMNDLACLGIDNDRGTLPSVIKTKLSRFKRRERRNGLSPVQRVGKSHLARKAPNRSKSAASSSSGGDSSRSEHNKLSSSPLNRKNAPLRSASGPISFGKGATCDSQNDPLTHEMVKSGRDHNRDARASNPDDSSSRKGRSRRSRSSSVKRNRGSARKNITLVASLYDESLMDSIATGLPTDDVLIVGGSRRRRGDEESQTSTRREDEKCVATHSSGRWIPREEASYGNTRRPTSNRKVRSPNRRKGAGIGSVSLTPCPDLTPDSHHRAIDTPPRPPMKGAPMIVKHIPKEKPREQGRASNSQ